MHDSWKDWFYFTKKERNGIFVLFFLLLIVGLAPLFYPKFIPQDDSTISALDLQRQFAELKQIEQHHNQDTTLQVEKGNNLIEGNNINKSTPTKTQKPKTTIVDTKKNRPQNIQTNILPKQQKRTDRQLNINTATVEDWKQLHGIGDVFAQRIVKFRNALGGFVSIDQVGKTYGLPPETFQSIKPQLMVAKDFTPKQVHVNTATVTELKAHPYISPKLAEQMINFREKVHPFSSDEDLLKLYFVNEEKLQELKPYITYQ